MLALGVGGWVAGPVPLDHAMRSSKSLLFMCSGSVIHACHTNEMTKIGRAAEKKIMPLDRLPRWLGRLPGDHRGRRALFFDWAQRPLLERRDPGAGADVQGEQTRSTGWLFVVAAGGSGHDGPFTCFRLWYLTFRRLAARPPRLRPCSRVARGSCTLPLGGVGRVLPYSWAENLRGLSVQNLLEQARPAGTIVAVDRAAADRLALPPANTTCT